MKRLLYSLSVLLSLSVSSHAQTTAVDFTMDDCNGVMHNLFSELDPGNVIILEYFMNCSSCIAAGQEIEAMKAFIDAQYPGKLDFYQLAYTNTMSCMLVNQFVNINGFGSVPFDSGATTMAYYGGFMMPTIVVVAGSQHEVIYTNVPAGGADTAAMGTAIRSFLGATSIEEESSLAAVHVFPNPAGSFVNLEVIPKNNSALRIELVNETGQLLDEIFNGNVSGFSRKIETSSLSNGIYFIRISEGSRSQNHRFTVLH